MSWQEVAKYLIEKWKTPFGGSTTWTIWDVPRVEAIVHPELAKETQVTTPPENWQRNVGKDEPIQANAMKDDDWNAATKSLDPHRYRMFRDRSHAVNLAENGPYELFVEGDFR